MAASRDTRYHEAAHAVTAHMLRIGIGEEGVMLMSDQEAWAAVDVTVPNNADEDWFMRRVAAKLAGPLAMCRLRQQALEWDTLRATAEYHTDFEESLVILRGYWAKIGGGNDELIDAQMDRAARISLECITKNEAAICAVAKASEGKERLSRVEIIGIIEASAACSG